MNNPDIYALRDIFNREQIMLCFNGPFNSSLIEEIGKALRKHMENLEESPSSISDVFSVYIEMTQNISRYTQQKNLQDQAAVSTILVSRDEEGHYIVNAGNIVTTNDGEVLAARVAQLSNMNKNELKAEFKTQLRQPRNELIGEGAGLGLIDMARKASQGMRAALKPLENGWSFFSLRVVI